ncbi:MAG: hypothetical protein ACYCPV_00365 [Thermoplasmata archaeon]
MTRTPGGPPTAPAAGGSGAEIDLRRAREGRTLPRVVQRSGPSSLMVSLPREWTQREEVRAGQFVYWLLDPLGSLSLIASTAPGTPPPVRTFSRRWARVDGDLLRRVLRSAYVLGYDRVVLESGEPMTEPLRELAERATHELLGFGLTERTPSRIVAVSFLDPTTRPVGEVIGRMGMAVDLLLERLETALSRGTKEGLARCAEMDTEIRRLQALALRQLNLAAADGRRARPLGVYRASHLLGNRVVVETMDDLAEAVQFVVGQLVGLRRWDPPLRSVLRPLAERVSAIRTDLAQALEALRNGSSEGALGVLDRRREDAGRLLRTDAGIRRLPARLEYRASMAQCSLWIGIAHQNVRSIAEVAFTRSLVAEDSSGALRP